MYFTTFYTCTTILRHNSQNKMILNYNLLKNLQYNMNQYIRVMIMRFKFKSVYNILDVAV